MITDKTKAMVATLYREGLTIAEICKRTGIRSSATIYNIVTELGIKGEKGKKRGTFSVVLTLPIELREWVEEQGEGLSELVTKVGYMEIEGTSEKRNLGAKVGYTRFEGTSGKTDYTESEGAKPKPIIRDSRVQNDGIKISRVVEDEMPFSQIEGKERISDIKTICRNSQSEPLGEVENSNSESDCRYRNSQGLGEPQNSDLGTTEPVRLRVVLLRNAHEVASNTILSFVDEDAVKSISLALFGSMCEQLNADEIAIYEDGGQLLWLWGIEKQPLL